MFGTNLTDDSRNIKHEYELQTGVEFSLLPHKEAIRQSFTLRYQLSYAYADYFKETVYDKTQESLSFQTEYTIVRDQLSLPKGEATLEEVLMQQRELATSYDFSTMIALTCFFGSKYANIVNTRFYIC